MQAALQPLSDVRQATGDFAGHEGFATAWGFVVEENPVAGIHAVGFAVVHRDPVGVELGDCIRGTRVERRGFLLRNLLNQAIEL